MEATPARGVPRAFALVGIVGIIAVALGLTMVSASLYGDGSAMLIQAIQAGGSFVSRSRWLLNDLRDAPVVLLVQAGVTNLRVLSWGQGLGYIGIAAAFWSAALWLSLIDVRRFTIVASAAGMCLGAMASFGSLELLTALGMVTLLSILLSDPRPWRPWMSIVAVCSSAILVIAHEAVALCAVIWGVHALVRGRRSSTAHERVACYVAAAFALGCIAWAVTMVVDLPAGGEHGFFWALQEFQPVFAVMLLVATSAVMACAFATNASPVIRLPLVALAIGLLVVAVYAGVIQGPGVAFPARAWSLVAVLLAQGLLAYQWWRDGRPAPEGGLLPRWPALLALGFLLSSLVIPVGNAVLWWQGVGAVREVVTSRSGPLLAPIVLDEVGNRALWSWTNPSLSVVLRSTDRDGILLDPETARGDPAPWLLFPSLEAQQQLGPEYSWR